MIPDDIVATRREMVKYDKNHRFVPHEGMEVYAYVDDKLVDLDDNRAFCPKDLGKKVSIFTLAPKSFVVLEVKKEIEVIMQCQKFGLSSGVKLKLEPHTTARSITLLLMKCGTTETEGNENIGYIGLAALRDLLQESFDSAMDRIEVHDIDDELFAKIVEECNREGEFADYHIEVVSACKAE